jgi:hypothetical protein
MPEDGSEHCRLDIGMTENFLRRGNVELCRVPAAERPSKPAQRDALRRTLDNPGPLGKLLNDVDQMALVDAVALGMENKIAVVNPALFSRSQSREELGWKRDISLAAAEVFGFEAVLWFLADINHAVSDVGVPRVSHFAPAEDGDQTNEQY